MPDSYFSPLSSVLSSSAIQSIAGHFGVPEQTILSGVHSSMAATVSGLAQRSNDAGFISHLAQMASSTPEGAVSSALSSDALTNPNSSSIAGGNQLLNSVFGGRLGSLANAVSGQTSLGSAATSSLMALSATTVLGLLGRKLRDGSLNESSLPGFLQNESNTLQGYIPRGFGTPAAAGTYRDPVVAQKIESDPVVAQKIESDPVVAQKIDIDPVVAQSVQRKRSIWPWLLPLLLAALLLGFWGLRPRRVPVAVVTRPPVSAPSAPVSAPPAPVSAPTAPVPVKVCDASTLNAPQRLLFDTDSATLQPQSTDQLTNVVTILRACPSVRLRVGGYTDNTGSPGHNQVLSQQRADSVCHQLEAMGIGPDRLSARGYGDTHPVADNSTPDGRALNRRITILVIQK